MLSRAVRLSTSSSSIIFHKAYVHECSAEQAASATSYQKVAGVIVRARWGERRCSSFGFPGKRSHNVRASGEPLWSTSSSAVSLSLFSWDECPVVRGVLPAVRFSRAKVPFCGGH